MAAFTRLEPAQALAGRSATSSDGAPSTETSSRIGPPSPSAAISVAICWQSSSSAPEGVDAGPGSAMGALPALPLASRRRSRWWTWPRPRERLKLRRMACRSATESIGGVMAQSVATTDHRRQPGRDHPSPCRCRSGSPPCWPMRTDRAPSLMRVSWSDRLGGEQGVGLQRMRPARGGRHDLVRRERSRIPRSTRSLTALAPDLELLGDGFATVFSPEAFGPVRALALPLLITTARIPSEGSRSRRRGPGRLARFCVKQPAAEQGVSCYTSARSLRFGLMPACMPAQRTLGYFHGGTPQRVEAAVSPSP